LDRRTLKADADKEAQTLVLHRWSNDAAILAFMNFSKAPQTIPFANTAGFKTILDSAAKEWNGPGDSEIHHNAISIQPESIVILSDSLFTAHN
jgi:hypothetical protein